MAEREGSPETSPSAPRSVALFSGHVLDAPGRARPRFPPDKEAVAANAIAVVLADLRIGSDDLAICGGARGGDLFTEAALTRQVTPQAAAARRTECRRS